MQTADAYFRVHQYRGVYAGALYTVERGHDLVGRITELSKELVPRVEIDRARNVLADLEQRAASARQEWRVQSANLTQVLRFALVLQVRFQRHVEQPRVQSEKEQRSTDANQRIVGRCMAIPSRETQHH